MIVEIEESYFTEKLCYEDGMKMERLNEKRSSEHMFPKNVKLRLYRLYKFEKNVKLVLYRLYKFQKNVILVLYR